jgi:hypothetical protein
MTAVNRPLRWLVITPTLGISPYLFETTESIKRLPGTVEHIVVCPLSVLSKVTQLLPMTRVVAEPVMRSVGMYGAINIGIKSAETVYDYICYLNDDDYFLPSIELLNDSILDSKSINYGRTLMINGDGERLYEAPIVSCSRFINIFIEKGITPFMQPSMIIPNFIINKIGLFDEGYRYCGDLEFILRAIKFKVPFNFINIPLSSFRIHGQQLSASEFEMTREKNLAYKSHCINIDSSASKLFIKIAFTIMNFSKYISRLVRTGNFTSKTIFYSKK